MSETGGSGGAMLGGAGGMDADASGEGGLGGSGGSDSACASVDLQTDSAHCGQCAHSCLGAACVAGLCEPSVVLDRYSSIYEFVIDETSVYFRETEAVSSVPKAGGTETELFVPVRFVHNLQVQDDQLYFTQEADDEDTTNGLYRMPVTGGARTAVFEGYDDGVFDLAVRGERAFFAGYCAALFRVPLTGGAPEAITSTSCSSPGGGTFAVAPSGALGYSGNGIAVTDLMTGEGTLLKQDTSTQHMIASDERVYFAVETNCEGAIGDVVCRGGWIEAMDSDGSNDELLIDLATIEAPEGYESIGGMALDERDLFFELIEVGHGKRRLFAVPLAGGPARLLALMDDSSEAGIAVDEAFVYFLHDGQKLHRVPK